MKRCDKLAGYRAMLKKTQKDFAELIKVTNQTYSKKENGQIPFKPKEMETLKNYIKETYSDVTIDSLFF
ncbi:helix-turn-helix domain-containing protein [Streptococcus danieliae]|nr:helix-turn-helix domain-containing protein [Streptococcus danieliae]